jgi:hypothetical protein
VQPERSSGAPPEAQIFRVRRPLNPSVLPLMLISALLADPAVPDPTPTRSFPCYELLHDEARPSPPKVDGFAFEAAIDGWNMCWRVWADCPSCYWTADEVVLHRQRASAFLHSTRISRGDWMTSMGPIDQGKGIVDSSTGFMEFSFVYFNPKLCSRYEMSSCRPLKNFIVVFDVPRQQVRRYQTFEAFARAEGNPFTCRIDERGAADCTFRNELVPDLK